VFLPFTLCFGGNALWCERDYGVARDYRPIELMPGDAFLFDGGYLDHGTFEKETEITRCSLDFPLRRHPHARCR
jgi:ectoine hydroxylase-related dioxygenase (phytanoyl-CoA dioxygenase family)